MTDSELRSFGTYHLFNDIYYRLPATSLKNIYHYYHKCSSKGPDTYDSGRIDNNGICGKCNTYIMPYKKLETMVALKELTG